MTFWRSALRIAAKDLRIELRSKEVVVTSSLFGLLVAVLTSLSFYLDDVGAQRLAPGVLYVAASFSGVLAMGRSWARERENNAFRALMQAPIPRSAIYVGKALSTGVFILLIDLLLLPIVAVLFHIDPDVKLLMLGALLALAMIGYVGLGTLFAAMSVKTRARDLMLSIVLFPLSSPGLLAGIVASRDLLTGTPISELVDWLPILFAFDLVAIASGLVLFEPLMSD